jgi:hypothetical protein
VSGCAHPRTVDPPPIELHSCTVPTAYRLAAYFGGRLALHDLGHMARSMIVQSLSVASALCGDLCVRLGLRAPQIDDQLWSLVK